MCSAKEHETECPLLQVSHTALNTSENILMCAPTGAGKTNVAMLAILHTMSLYRNAETGKIDTSKFKIVYVAPMKVPKGSPCTIVKRPDAAIAGLLRRLQLVE